MCSGLRTSSTAGEIFTSQRSSQTVQRKTALYWARHLLRHRLPYPRQTETSPICRFVQELFLHRRCASSPQLSELPIERLLSRQGAFCATHSSSPFSCLHRLCRQSTSPKSPLAESPTCRAHPSLRVRSPVGRLRCHLLNVLLARGNLSALAQKILIGFAGENHRLVAAA